MRAAFAWLEATGPAGGVAIEGVSSNAASGRETERGFGDVVLSLTYATEVALVGTTYVDLTARTKIPTADEDRALGTGAADFSAKVELFTSHGAWTPSAAVGYRVLGDSGRYRLDNGWLASAGIDRRMSSTINIGGLIDWREPASSTSHDSLELVPYLSWRLGGGVTVTGYATVGPADGSPRKGAGLQIGFCSDR